MTFRTDINGLRAIAVLSVFLHHFGIPGFVGGYVGVDIFFVISGYLMTKIIYTKLSEEKFSLISFYAARARRILPVLGVVIAFILIAGYFCLISVDYKMLGKTSFSALTFFSNVVFADKVSYFDISALEKWLLNTWSMSVEWQFYMLLPLFLIGLNKFKDGRFLKQGVVGAFILSMWINLVMAKDSPLPLDDFFLLPPRIWEFLAGGLVFLYAPTFSRIPYLREAGLIFILIPVFFFPDDDIAYPGYWAILPVSGTAFIIAAQKRNFFLDNKVAQFFGNISYSLYLWHWPLLIGVLYFGIPLFTFNVIVLMSFFIFLATVSYKFIETPFRQKEKSRKRSMFLIVGFIGYLFVALLSWLVFFFEGLPARMPPDVKAIELEVKNAKKDLWRYDFNHKNSPFIYKTGNELPKYIIGAERTTPSAVLWGDSHAGALSLSMKNALTETGRAAIIYNYSNCPPILGAIISTGKSEKYVCKYLNQDIYDRIISNPDIKDVFMISRWSVYLQGYDKELGPHPYIVFGSNEKANKNNLKERSKQYIEKIVETACALTSHGKNVYMMTPIPEMGRRVPTLMAKSRLFYHRDTTVDIPLSVYMQRHAPVLEALKKAKKECGIHILDPRPLLCDGFVCSGTRNKKSMYVDDSNLNAFGNQIIKPLFDEALRNR